MHHRSLTSIALGILIRRKEVAEVGLLAVGDPLCLRLAAAIVRRCVVIRAVQSAVNIGPALRAFFLTRDIAGFKLHFLATMMTNH